MTVLPSNPFDSFAPSTLSYNYYWTLAQGASWGQYLRSRDVVDAINGGSAAASAHLARCMSQNCQALIGSVSSLESNLSSSIGSLESTVEDSISSLKWTLVDSIDAMGHQIAYAFTWGFSSLLAYLGSMRATAEDLLRVARASVSPHYLHF